MPLAHLKALQAAMPHQAQQPLVIPFRRDIHKHTMGSFRHVWELEDLETFRSYVTRACADLAEASPSSPPFARAWDKQSYK